MCSLGCSISPTEHLCGADIFVQVSVKNESFGLPVLEATAAGVPVVAARSLRRLIIGGDLRSLGWNMKVDVEGLICNLRN
jgi:glycosyltransferase involved in cell wall biosynthesis